MSCQPVDRLQEFVSGELAAKEQGTVKKHLTNCPRCRETVETLESDENLFDALKNAVRRSPSLDTPHPPLEGELLKQFRIENTIHYGGQGVVYTATQQDTGRKVAIKVLLRGRRATARERFRFEREIDIATRLRHPNIVTIYDSGSTEQNLYYAMEYIEGKRLDEHVQTQGLNLRDKLALLHKVTCAVVYAHRHGVIHRDLKPGNILVDKKGEPHVLDFGVAKAFREDDPPRHPRITHTGEFMGTLMYASPEQISGDPEGVDVRSDVYSLGVLLYETVTGHPPYNLTGDVASSLRTITETLPADPRTHLPALSDDLHTILMRSLQKEPERRYASSEALAEDLERHLAGEPIEATADSSWYLIRKMLRRHRTPVALSGVALLLVLFGSLLLLRLWQERDAERVARLKTHQVFQDLLASASPERMGGNVTLLSVYEQAAERIERDLPDEVDAQAAVRYTIGETYFRLFQMTQAESHLRQAVAHYETTHGDSHLEVARCKNLLGLVLTSRKEHEEAIATQREALRIRSQDLSSDDPLVAESQRCLGLALQYSGDPEDLEEVRGLYDQALAKFLRHHGEPHMEVSRTRHRIARLAATMYSEQGAQAVDNLFQKALQGYRLLPDHQDPRAVECLSDYASLLESQARIADADDILEELVATAERLYGSQQLDQLLWSLASLQLGRNHLVAAEQLYRVAVALRLEEWIDMRPDHQKELEDLAQSLKRPSSVVPRKAPPFLEAFALLRELMGNGSYEILRDLIQLTEVTRAKGQVDQTERLLREGLEIQCRALGRNCNYRVQALQLLGEVLMKTGRANEALSGLEEAMATVIRVNRQESSLGSQVKQSLWACKKLVEGRP